MGEPERRAQEYAANVQAVMEAFECSRSAAAVGVARLGSSDNPRMLITWDRRKALEDIADGARLFVDSFAHHPGPAVASGALERMRDALNRLEADHG